MNKEKKEGPGRPKKWDEPTERVVADIPTSRKEKLLRIAEETKGKTMTDAIIKLIDEA